MRLESHFGLSVIVIPWWGDEEHQFHRRFVADPPYPGTPQLLAGTNSQGPAPPAEHEDIAKVFVCEAFDI